MILFETAWVQVRSKCWWAVPCNCGESRGVLETLAVWWWWSSSRVAPTSQGPQLVLCFVFRQMGLRTFLFSAHIYRTYRNCSSLLYNFTTSNQQVKYILSNKFQTPLRNNIGWGGEWEFEIFKIECMTPNFKAMNPLHLNKAGLNCCYLITGCLLMSKAVGC